MKTITKQNISHNILIVMPYEFCKYFRGGNIIVFLLTAIFLFPVMPIVRNRITGPMWLHFLVGVSASVYAFFYSFLV